MINLIYPVSIIVGCLLISLEWNVTKFIKYHALFSLFVFYVILIFDSTSSAFYWGSTSTGFFIVKPIMLSVFSGYIFGLVCKKIELPKG